MSHSDVAMPEDAVFEGAIEGFVPFALDLGKVCTGPSRALIHEYNHDRFMQRARVRTEAIIQADPRDAGTCLRFGRNIKARRV